MLAALKHGVVFLDETRFVHFLEVVTRNCARTLERGHASAKRWPIQPVVVLTVGAWTIASSDPGPVDSASSKELLRSRLAVLPLAEREVIVWSLLGYHPVELARRLGLKVRSLRRVVERVRSRWIKLDAQ